ncbi:hypothetical protein KFE25_001888 [Diacronema lutheri]|mgnify:CR=1 FL=1|uniref:C2H2-type domain-containing protein n=1 Tax=Diacronema lutheri TaxID=2081491 RepID=A0A8J6C952_DIALT|nr:hypothetical protein KFE25_001888 [Diacronema lutheri]
MPTFASFTSTEMDARAAGVHVHLALGDDASDDAILCSPCTSTAGPSSDCCDVDDAMSAALDVDDAVDEPSAQADAPGKSTAPQKMAPVLLTQAEERSFTCEVCRKTFKRETNLMFHMATHRQQGAGDQHCWNAPVQCSACPKIFATKYQAKKHFLRRHFQGERRFACTRCNLKAFAVKEDLTTHMKTCGRTFACSCGARPRSLAALNKHCTQSGHTPAAAAAATAAAAAAAALGLSTPPATPTESPRGSPLQPQPESPTAVRHDQPFNADDVLITEHFLASIDASELLDAPLCADGFFSSDEDILTTLSSFVA